MKQVLNSLKAALLLSTVSILSILAVTAYFPLGSTAYAVPCDTSKSKILGIEPWYRGLECEGGSPVLTNISEAVTTIILNIINIIFSIVGYVAVGFVIWGGIRYMIAGGEPGNITSARKTIQNALIGLLIALSALAIVNFVIGLYT